MRVFVTGATGHIGSVVVPELLRAGHEVTGLARSDKAAASLEAAGAKAHSGAIDDPGVLRAAAAAAEGVIHLAYMHGAPAHIDAGAADRRAVEAIGAALEGSGKPFVVTSGTLVLKGARLGTEADAPDPDAPALARIAAENAAVALIAIARAKGVSAYVGDGANRWPAVHTLDAARLFLLALESAPAGSRLHRSDEAGVSFLDIAGVIGRHLNLPVLSVPPAVAAVHFGWLSFAVSADNPTSSTLTRELLGWSPYHPGLIADLEDGHYFKAPGF